MPATGQVRISGLRELNRALGKINREVQGEVYDELKRVSEPVRAEAEHKAFTSIRNIGSVWGAMRTGATMTSVYIAPSTRRSRGSARPNFGTLLLDKAMWPALEEKQDSITEDVADAFDRLAFRAGFH